MRQPADARAAPRTGDGTGGPHLHQQGRQRDEGALAGRPRDAGRTGSWPAGLGGWRGPRPPRDPPGALPPEHGRDPPPSVVRAAGPRAGADRHHPRLRRVAAPALPAGGRARPRIPGRRRQPPEASVRHPVGAVARPGAGRHRRRKDGMEADPWPFLPGPAPGPRAGVLRRERGPGRAGSSELAGGDRRPPGRMAAGVGRDRERSHRASPGEAECRARAGRCAAGDTVRSLRRRFGGRGRAGRPVREPVQPAAGMDSGGFRPRPAPGGGRPGAGPGGLRRGRPAVQPVGAFRPGVPRRVRAHGPGDLRRSAGAGARPAARPPPDPGRAQGAIQGHPGGRVPGHRSLAVRDPAVAVRGAFPGSRELARDPPRPRQAVRRGGPQAIHLRVPGRGHGSLPERGEGRDRGPERRPAPTDRQLP